MTDQQYEEAVAEGATVIFSRNIQASLGLEKVPDNIDFSTLRFKVVVTNRCFRPGWVKLLEVLPKNKDAMWPTLRGGTATINLPPDNIRALFVKDLKAALQ